MSSLSRPAPARGTTGQGTTPFVPHPWLRGGHAQTIAGRYLAFPPTRPASTEHLIDVSQGDRLSIHESTPGEWRRGDPAVVLVHGLAGCAESAYVVRVGSKLHEMGLRVVRMNLRGAGTGFGLARGIYHAGRSDDVRAVVSWLSHRAERSPIALVGFSLGGNLALKLAAEAGDEPVAGLDCVVAANPPIDLASCARAMRRPENRLYDRSFTRWLRREATRLHAQFPDLGPPDLKGIRSVHEFDDRYTSRRNGFASADEYYERCSTANRIADIELPGLVVHAMDDPFIPAEAFRRAVFPDSLEFELTDGGGHLGYLSRDRENGDRRWLDTRLLGWLSSRWSVAPVGRLVASTSLARGPNPGEGHTRHG